MGVLLPKELSGKSAAGLIPPLLSPPPALGCGVIWKPSHSPLLLLSPSSTLSTFNLCEIFDCLISPRFLLLFVTFEPSLICPGMERREPWVLSQLLCGRQVGEAPLVLE